MNINTIDHDTGHAIIVDFKFKSIFEDDRTLWNVSYNRLGLFVVYLCVCFAGEWLYTYKDLIIIRHVDGRRYHHFFPKREIGHYGIHADDYRLCLDSPQQTDEPTPFYVFKLTEIIPSERLKAPWHYRPERDKSIRVNALYL